MNVDVILQNIQLYLLIFARIFAVFQIAPLTGSTAIPGLVRIGLTLFVAAIMMPLTANMAAAIPTNVGLYIIMMVGEILLGIIMGFLVTLMFSAFQVSGQFFSIQMGFGASQVFDALSQVQIPVMGQFLNNMAMLVFLMVGGFQKLIVSGIYTSFKAVNSIDLVAVRAELIPVFINGLAVMFQQALVIAFPIFGTLFLVSISMGLLAKAAPQLNLLMLSFPISIGVAFLMLVMALPLLVEVFTKLVDGTFYRLQEILVKGVQ